MPTIDDLLREAYSSWDDAETLRRTGRELQDRNRLDRAKEILARAVELDPEGHPKTWEHLAFAHFRSFEDEEGTETLRRGLEATGSDSVKATLAGFTGDEEEAEKLREDLADSRDPAIRASAMMPRLYGGEAAPVLEEVRALMAEHPDDEDLRNTYFWMLLGARKQKVEGLDLRETGLPLVNAKIDEDPDRVSGHWLKQQMYGVEEDWDGVLEATAETLSRMPDEETAMQQRGRAFREKGDLERAAGWFSRAIGAKPSFAGARVDLGKTYEQMERLDLAEEVFREIPVANPDYPGGPVSLALFLARCERWEEAETLIVNTWPDLPEWFHGALRDNPDAAPLLAREAVKAVVD